MKFITSRRYYLDRLLFNTHFSGKVLDVGGKKYNKRGLFRPPLDKVISWEYLNIDASTQPDYFCSADKIPVGDNHFDMVIMTEVLEHIENPVLVLEECFRVLKNKGTLIVTIPFLAPIHHDPLDFQRWAPSRIQIELEKVGFKIEKIMSMGGIIAVVSDIINFYLDNLKPTLFTKFIKRLILVSAPLLLFFDYRVKLKDRITTGFYIEAKKAIIQ